MATRGFPIGNPFKALKERVRGKSKDASESPVASTMKKIESRRAAPVMGSMANIDTDRIGKGGFDAKPAARSAAPKPTGNKPKFKTEKVDISTGGEYDTRGAGMMGTPGGEAAERPGRTTTFGEDTSSEAEAPKMRKGLFGEDISQEDYDRMTEKNKAGSFWGQFKKGGKVKKAAKSGYKSGGSVKASSASKRGGGIAQRGKTRGRFV